MLPPSPCEGLTLMACPENLFGLAESGMVSGIFGIEPFIISNASVSRVEQVQEAESGGGGSIGRGGQGDRAAISDGGRARESPGS